MSKYLFVFTYLIQLVLSIHCPPGSAGRGEEGVIMPSGGCYCVIRIKEGGLVILV